jgi:hypothetical protein
MDDIYQLTGLNRFPLNIETENRCFPNMGREIPVKICIVVIFPAPFGPKKPNVSLADRKIHNIRSGKRPIPVWQDA